MINNPKVVRWAESEIAKYLHDLILIEPNQTLSVFQHYKLIPGKKSTGVYEKNHIRGTFRDTRTALSWCVAQKFRRLDLAKQIQHLDSEYRTLLQDIELRKQLAFRSRHLPFRDAVLTKLQPKLQYHSTIDLQLEKCIRLTKYLQRKGFQNETARTRCV